MRGAPVSLASAVKLTAVELVKVEPLTLSQAAVDLTDQVHPLDDETETEPERDFNPSEIELGVTVVAPVVKTA